MKEKIISVLKSKVFFAAALNTIILLFCVAVSSFSYVCDKDFYNSLFICQYHNYYSNEINYILSTIVGSAQYVLSNFNCFVLAQIAFSWLAFCSITYVFSDKFSKSRSFVFTLIVTTLFALNHYADIQSVKTSALLLASGFLLVLNAIRNKRYNAPCWIGVVEIVFGSFFCFKYFFVALAFAIVYFIAEMIAKQKYKIKFRKFFWFFRPYLLLFVLITALVFGCEWYSYSVNHSTAQASEYYEYSELSDSIDTLSYPGYKEHQEEFESVGLSEDDYELLKDGYFDSSTSLNNKSLSLVLEIQKRENPKNVWNQFVELCADNAAHFVSFDCTAIVIIVFLLVIGIYIFCHKKRYWFFPILYLLLSLVTGVCIRLFFTGADYLVYGARLLPFVFLLYSFDFDNFRVRQSDAFVVRRHGAFFVAATLSLCLFICYSIVYQANSDYTLSTKSKPSNLYVEIDRHPECYYVLDPVTENEYVRHTDNYTHPLWGFRTNFMQNVDNFGCYNKTEQLISHNLSTNIYEAVLSNNKIYVIDNYITYRKENYLKAHYAKDGENVVYTQTKELNKFKVYEVVVN